MVFWLKKSSGIPEKGRKIDFLPGRRALLMKTAYTQGYLNSDLRSLDQKPDKRRLNKRILFLNLQLSINENPAFREIPSRTCTAALLVGIFHLVLLMDRDSHPYLSTMPGHTHSLEGVWFPRLEYLTKCSTIDKRWLISIRLVSTLEPGMASTMYKNK